MSQTPLRDPTVIPGGPLSLELSNVVSQADVPTGDEFPLARVS